MAVEEEQGQPVIVDGPFVKANAHRRKPEDPPGLMVSPRVDQYFTAQAGRLPDRGIGNIPFDQIQFSLVTQDQIEATEAAAIIMSYDHVDTAKSLDYHRPDHELTAMDVFGAYYSLRNHAYLEAYLKASERIDLASFSAKRDKVVSVRETEGPIQIPLVQHLTLTLMQKRDLQAFYAGLASNMQEPELKNLLAGFATDQENMSTFLLGRVQSELAEDPSRLEEVDTALLGFEPYGHDFDPDFQKHRALMLRVSSPGVLRADLLRQTVTDIVGAEHRAVLEQRRPFKEKLLTG